MDTCLKKFEYENTCLIVGLTTSVNVWLTTLNTWSRSCLTTRSTTC